MRLRRIAGAQEKLESHPEIMVLDPENHKGNWRKLFGNDNPVHIEIGMGKGQFIEGMAKQFPEINFVGIEVFESVMVRALEKFIDNPLDNLRLLKVNAHFLLDYFETNEVSRVYLNFSDPWPKLRHSKRRLTHGNFLKLYEEIIDPEGDLWFKSDNRHLFEFSLESLNNYGMIFDSVCLNLHEDEPEHNIRTEYEVNWSNRGYPIYRIEARFPQS